MARLPGMPLLRTPADLIAMVPYVLGFHPTDSLVVLGLRGRAVVFQARGDLPAGADAGPFADYYAQIVARQRVEGAIVLGYGSGARVTPVVLAVRDALTARRVPVFDVLRVEADRYWSYVCTNPECCPAEGVRFDLGTSRVAAAAVAEGCVALPSRSALEHRFAPVCGTERAAMREAAPNAQRLLDALTTGLAPAVRTSVLVAAGRKALGDAIDGTGAGGRLDADEAARLLRLLDDQAVRELAWECVRGDLGTHIALWTDLLRRAEGRLVVAPACLLAFAAWRAGEGAVAAIAVERALAEAPDDPIAGLLEEALRHGLSPAEWERARQRALSARRSYRSVRPAQKSTRAGSV